MKYQVPQRDGGILAVIVMVLILACGAWAQSSEKVLHVFSAGGDGAPPTGGLILDPVGRLYGTTYRGGPQSAGTVYEIAPKSDGTWSHSVLGYFDFNNGAFPGVPLLLYAPGIFYGTASVGGSVGDAYELVHSSPGVWDLHSIYDFHEAGDGASPRAPLIRDAAGNLYGTAVSGGSQDAGTVFELTPNSNGSWSEHTLHNFTLLLPDGNSPVTPLVFDAQGNLYGVTPAGGKGTNCSNGIQGCGVAYKLSPNGDGSWTETGLWHFNGSGKGAEPSTGLVPDKAGDLYGATSFGGSNACTSGCGVIYRLSPNSNGGWTESVVYSFHSAQDGWGNNGSLVFDKAGNLYGTSAQTVYKLTPAASGEWKFSTVYSFVGQPAENGVSPDHGVIFDAAGNLYGTTDEGGDLTCGSDGLGCGVVYEITP